MPNPGNYSYSRSTHYHRPRSHSTPIQRLPKSAVSNVRPRSAATPIPITAQTQPAALATTSAPSTFRFADTAIGQMFARADQSARRTRPPSPTQSPASGRVAAARKTPSPVSSAAMQALQQDDEWVGPTPGADSDSAPYTTDSPERGLQASRRFIDDEARDGEGNTSDEDTNGDDLIPLSI